MKNKFAIVLLGIFLLLPISVQAVADNIPADTESQAVEDIVQTQQLDEDIQQEPQENVLQSTDAPFKQPLSKRKLIKKFLLAMFAVVISSAALYAGLSLYNNIRGNFRPKTKTSEGEITLETPNDIESAVKTFLEKTKWN